MLYALRPRWVERRGIFGLYSLLRGRRGRAFADGTRVEDRLERLDDPGESDVTLVIEYGEFLEDSELVNGCLSWGWRSVGASAFIFGRHRGPCRGVLRLDI